MTSQGFAPRTRPTTLALLGLALAAVVPGAGSFGQDDARPRPATSDVRDEAGMFDPEIVRKARAMLAEVERKTGAAALIETVETLPRDETIEEAATRRARRLGSPGLYVLIDKKDHKFEIRPVRLGGNGLDRARQTAIRNSFLSSFRERDFDGGLLQGIRTIETAFAELKDRGELRPDPGAAWPDDRPEGSDPTPGLILRGQVRLTLEGARRIVAGSEAKAAEMRLKMNIAVVDDGGHLLTFARMDGARPASGYTAMTKATTAATFRQETGPMPRGAPAADVHLSLSLQNAAAASGGKLTTLLGGVPVVVDGQVIGGIGVGGGSGEQDAEVARAGLARFLAGIKPSASNTDSPRPEPVGRGNVR